jgi:hypothetical protein
VTPEERRALFVILTVIVLAPLIANRAAKGLRLLTLVPAIVLDILVGPHVVGWSRTNHVTDVFAAIGVLFPAKADPGIARGLQRVTEAFVKLQDSVKKLKTQNNWLLLPKDMGVPYGTTMLAAEAYMDRTPEDAPARDVLDGVSVPQTGPASSEKHGRGGQLPSSARAH